MTMGMRGMRVGSVLGAPVLRVTVPLHGTFATPEDRETIGRVAAALSADYGEPVASVGGLGGHQLAFAVPREVPQVTAYLRAHAVLEAMGYTTAAIDVVQEADLAAIKVAARLSNGNATAPERAAGIAGIAGTAGTEMAPGVPPLAPLDLDTPMAEQAPPTGRQRRRKGAAR